MPLYSRTGLRSAPPSLLSSSSSSSCYACDGFYEAKNGSIRVVTRVRPINETERALGNKPCITVDEGLVQVVRSSKATEFPFFDSCVSAEDNQDSAFEKFGVPELLDDALAGMNITLFAYGQTGSGKTHTIHDGIIPRSLRYLFDRLVGRDNDLDGLVCLEEYGLNGPPDNQPANRVASGSIVCGASFCEIYNDFVYDLLLSTSRPLKLKWDAGEGFHAPEIHIQPCNTLQDALAVLNLGNKRRRQRSHCLNAESSRSHAILTLYLFCGERAGADGGPDAMRTGISTKVHFVDLAGSERLKVSKNYTCQLAIRETAQINRSLFLLGNVICAIASNQPNHTVPYRDCTITKMLFGSMTWPSKVLMIACVSPSDGAVEESLTTLAYATRFARAEAVPVVRVEKGWDVVASLRRENRVLKEEIRILRGC